MDIREIVETTLVAPARAAAQESKFEIIRGSLDGDLHTDPVLAGLVYLDVTINGECISGWVKPRTALAIKRLDELHSCLSQIVSEYDNTYDASIEPGDTHWTAAASIPVEVMERAKALLK